MRLPPAGANGPGAARNVGLDPMSKAQGTNSADAVTAQPQKLRPDAADTPAPEHPCATSELAFKDRCPRLFTKEERDEFAETILSSLVDRRGQRKRLNVDPKGLMLVAEAEEAGRIYWTLTDAAPTKPVSVRAGALRRKSRAILSGRCRPAEFTLKDLGEMHGLGDELTWLALREIVGSSATQIMWEQAHGLNQDQLAKTAALLAIIVEQTPSPKQYDVPFHGFVIRIAKAWRRYGPGTSPWIPDILPERDTPFMAYAREASRRIGREEVNRTSFFQELEAALSDERRLKLTCKMVSVSLHVDGSEYSRVKISGGIFDR